MDIKKFVPVMITPFNLKANIDYEAIDVLIEFYLEAGVKGFFANCLSSEMYSISEDERLELTAYVVKKVNGRVPIVATGSFGLTIEDKAIFTKKIFATGIDAVILITGHFARVGDNEETLIANFEKMLQLTGDIPLGLYECPAPYKRILSANVFEKLIQTGRFVYHKDTSIEPEQVKAKLDLIKTNNNNAFEFYDAHTPNAAFSIRNGAKGMSSISGNFYPEIMVWLCNNATNDANKELVDWLQKELIEVDPLIHIAYPMSAKYFLQKRGLPIRTISRATAFELTPEQKNVLDNIYDKFVEWCKKLNIEVTK
jgi:4-hydroxy-tetrahydrodipicolinate synthase